MDVGPVETQGWLGEARTLTERAWWPKALEQAPYPVPERDLLRQLLLHLPRFPSSALGQPSLVEAEAQRLSLKLQAVRGRLSPLYQAPLPSLPLASAELREVDEPLALALHQSLHYLGSPRPGGTHLGLWGKTERDGEPRLMALLTLSAFDLHHADAAIPEDLAPHQVQVVSRLFAMEGAPPNSVSFLLGRVFAWLKVHREDVRMLLTYLDPNLGFHGTIYQATNWTWVGREYKERYLYLDGDYVTDRQMIRAQGTARFEELREIFGTRVARSEHRLAPLRLYRYRLDRLQRREPVRMVELTPASVPAHA